MKKLSILIALLLCVTISGVYATWTYVNESTDIFDVSKEILVELEDATTDGAAGTFSITTNLGLLIDQKEYGVGEKNLHEAELEYYSTDGKTISMTVTFTPSLNAGEDIRTNAVPAELYFTTTTDMTYYADDSGKLIGKESGVEPKDIFIFSNKADGKFAGDPNSENFDEDKDIDWVKQDDGTFSVTYTLDDLKEMIKLNTPIILDTKADYNHFASEHLQGTISVHVTDGTLQSGAAQG